MRRKERIHMCASECVWRRRETVVESERACMRRSRACAVLALYGFETERGTDEKPPSTDLSHDTDRRGMDHLDVGRSVELRKHSFCACFVSQTAEQSNGVAPVVDN